MRILGTLFSLFLATAALADSADVAVFAQTSNQFDSVLAIVNYGPDLARDLVLTIDYPAALKLKLYEPETRCDVTVRPARCTLGDLNVFPPPTYFGARFEAPLADATYTVTYTISSSTPDPKLENNVVTNSWSTKVEADLDVVVRPGGLTPATRIDPGQTASFETVVFNDVRDNIEPKNIRLELSANRGTIENIVAPPGYTCTAAGGATATCTSVELIGCCKLLQVTLRAPDDRNGGPLTLTVQASSDAPEKNPANNVARSSAEVYRWIAVTNALDTGAGSLRDAIGFANANCTPGPCRIVFEIPAPVPSEGWFTIAPVEPLPVITAERVTLEGSRQTALTGDTNPTGPEIAIDGRGRLDGVGGLRAASRCESVVEGLAIGNFTNAPAVVWSAPGNDCGLVPDRREVHHNHLGLNASGRVAWPNLRGISADGTRGRIANNIIAENRYSGVWAWSGSPSIQENWMNHNGASGVFLGPQVSSAEVLFNTIINHPQMGVAVAGGARQVDIRINAMKDNGGLGIDWGLDGVSPRDSDDPNGASNAPLLLSAVYDPAAKETLVTLTVHSTELLPYGSGGWLDFYSNSSPDGDGEHWIGSSQQPNTNGTITVAVSGDHRGEWLNATWTRVHFSFSRPPSTGITTDAIYGGPAATSELSNAILPLP